VAPLVKIVTLRDYRRWPILLPKGSTRPTALALALEKVCSFDVRASGKQGRRREINHLVPSIIMPFRFERQ
jgi:hypothetical protein